MESRVILVTIDSLNVPFEVGLGLVVRFTVGDVEESSSKCVEAVEFLRFVIVFRELLQSLVLLALSNALGEIGPTKFLVTRCEEELVFGEIIATLFPEAPTEECTPGRKGISLACETGPRNDVPSV